MELIVKGEFYRNVAQVKNRKLLGNLNVVIKQIQKAKKISEIQELKKLKKFDTQYRIKVSTDYRLGLVIRGNKVWLACFGHRNTFYKNFP